MSQKNRGQQTKLPCGRKRGWAGGWIIPLSLAGLLAGLPGMLLGRPCGIAGRVGAADLPVVGRPPLYQQFVLVRTGGLLTGRVQPVSGGIRVVGGAGDWVHVAGEDVVAVADTADAIVAARRRGITELGRSFTDLLVEEIRWCVDHRLAAQAARGLFDLHRVSPGDRRAGALEAQIRDLARVKPPSNRVPPRAADPSPVIQTVSHSEPVAPPVSRSVADNVPRRLPAVGSLQTAESFNRETELRRAWLEQTRPAERP